ncbi:MAG TPA: hypothetical protein DEA32_03355 [Firmicutes bacterium]|nr:hypothetical protein [Bacillota bacterium]
MRAEGKRSFLPAFLGSICFGLFSTLPGLPLGSFNRAFGGDDEMEKGLSRAKGWIELSVLVLGIFILFPLSLLAFVYPVVELRSRSMFGFVLMVIVMAAGSLIDPIFQIFRGAKRKNGKGVNLYGVAASAALGLAVFALVCFGLRDKLLIGNYANADALSWVGLVVCGLVLALSAVIPSLSGGLILLITGAFTGLIQNANLLLKSSEGRSWNALTLVFVSLVFTLFTVMFFNLRRMARKRVARLDTYLSIFGSVLTLGLTVFYAASELGSAIDSFKALEADQRAILIWVILGLALVGLSLSLVPFVVDLARSGVIPGAVDRTKGRREQISGEIYSPVYDDRDSASYHYQDQGGAADTSQHGDSATLDTMKEEDDRDSSSLKDALEGSPDVLKSSTSEKAGEGKPESSHDDELDDLKNILGDSNRR